MSIDKHYGTCEICGIVGIPLTEYGGKWVCDRDLRWEEDKKISDGAQDAVERHLKIFKQ